MDEKMTRSTSAAYEPFVDFKNLPDTTTPVDADNLNELQIEMKKYIDDNRSIPAGGITGQVLGKVSNADYNVGWINQAGTNYDSLPVGSILPYGSLTPPTGYLVCDGQEVSRTDYANLFSVIGTSFGEGDGSTTFNLPDFREGKSAVGYSESDVDFNTLGKTGGSKSHTQTLEELAAHNHGLPAYTYRGGGNQIQSGSGAWYASNPKDYTDNTGNSQPMDIMNPYVVICYIIKVSGTSILRGNVVDNLNDSSIENAPSQRIVKENIDNINKINTDITVDDNGWTKVIGLNVTTYFKNYTISTSIAGNGFLNFPSQPLPVDITTYDSTKMIASLATRFTDGAGIINAAISNGYKSISMCGQNKYGSQINGSILCNFRIDVYNSSTISTNE